ncbi:MULTISPECIES: hotdog fold domain-containing protein [unclassified Streptomyces]|uniref:hotdog fold domain-containing protein n=1 Tax=unclassified Streptomyces TaxID=2593676 RepID=UPI0004BD041B|nr:MULTISPECIES: hotdog fold domain-containing protein [unclassified Streptomyces]
MSDFETITVPERLHGYPGVAFGGYVAGVLATRAAAKDVRVDFRRPVPTGAPVRLAATAEGGCELTDGELLLAAATPVEAPAAPCPEAPSWDRAVEAAEAFRSDPPDGQADCFGCGLDRTPATGLRLHCGTVPGRELVAAAWTPAPELGGPDGLLPPELVWGALDCPGNAAGRLLDGRRAGAVTAALGARLLRPVPVGEGLVSYAWMLTSTGRKYTVGTALATADGELCAVAEALWVEPRT